MAALIDVLLSSLLASGRSISWIRSLARGARHDAEAPSTSGHVVGVPRDHQQWVEPDATFAYPHP
jgi:hypothetical protein